MLNLSLSFFFSLSLHLSLSLRLCAPAHCTTGATRQQTDASDSGIGAPWECGGGGGGAGEQQTSEAATCTMPRVKQRLSPWAAHARNLGQGQLKSALETYAGCSGQIDRNPKINKNIPLKHGGTAAHLGKSEPSSDRERGRKNSGRQKKKIENGVRSEREY